MTTNQINYFKAKLDEAHYERSDAENQRHNYAVEQISREQNEETRRANLVREQETHRANVANETNYYANLVENARHNQATEALTAENLSIQKERSIYQNLLDTANTNLANVRAENVAAETTLVGYKTDAQDTANKKAQLEYNLDVTYGETERATKPLSNVSILGVNVGSLAQAAINTVVTYASKTPASKYKTQKESKPYYQLKTR